MTNTMMRLGAYKFSIGTAAYQDLTRSTQYRWARQERIGTNDALQFTGTGPDTITLRGVVFPAYKGGLSQMSRMRLQAELAVPLPLIDGLGNILGLWVCEQINETQSIFAQKGAPLKQEFDLTLSRYSPSLVSLAKSYLGV